MGQILVRNLEDTVIERLKARALKADKSLEQTVRDILAEATKPSREEILRRHGAHSRADRAGRYRRSRT